MHRWRGGDVRTASGDWPQHLADAPLRGASATHGLYAGWHGHDIAAGAGCGLRARKTGISRAAGSGDEDSVSYAPAYTCNASK